MSSSNRSASRLRFSLLATLVVTTTVAVLVAACAGNLALYGNPITTTTAAADASQHLVLLRRQVEPVAAERIGFTMPEPYHTLDGICYGSNRRRVRYSIENCQFTRWVTRPQQCNALSRSAALRWPASLAGHA